jgi:hypothetical protein
MSLYNRDPYNPEWEPTPWDSPEDVAAEQERGFHRRAVAAIVWKQVPKNDFPSEDIFGHPREWFISNGIEFFASHAGEDLVLLQNLWHGPILRSEGSPRVLPRCSVRDCGSPVTVRSHMETAA